MEKAVWPFFILEKNMIEYMMNHQDGTIVYQTYNITIHKHSLIYTVNKLCMEHLCTYDGYLKSVQKQHHFSELIPIYLSETLQLIPIKRYRAYDNCYINYASIESYHQIENEIEIVFISGRKLYIKLSLYSFGKQLEKLKKIRNTKVKHFH